MAGNLDDRRKHRRTPVDMDNVCKINSPQVVKIKGDSPGNPSNEHRRLALGFSPVARADGGVVDAGDGDDRRAMASSYDAGVWLGWSWHAWSATLESANGRASESDSEGRWMVLVVVVFIRGAASGGYYIFVSGGGSGLRAKWRSPDCWPSSLQTT